MNEWTPAAIKMIQQLLMHIGHYRGKVDGVVGPKTIKAAEEWEQNY